MVSVRVGRCRQEHASEMTVLAKRFSGSGVGYAIPRARIGSITVMVSVTVATGELTKSYIVTEIVLVAVSVSVSTELNVEVVVSVKVRSISCVVVAVTVSVSVVNAVSTTVLTIVSVTEIATTSVTAVSCV